MKKETIYLSNLHEEHTQWNNELSLWKEEISSFTSRLEDVARRNTGKESMSDLEHFQNQLILHSEKIDELLHDISSHEHQLAGFAEKNPVAIDHKHFDDHADVRDRMKSQRKLFSELKEQLQNYLGKWM